MKSTTNKLNVLHITASLWMGGAERLLLELARHTDRQKVEPLIYAFGSFSDDSLLSDFQTLDLPLRLFPSKRFYNYWLWKDLFKFIRENEIDVIHTHLCDGDIVGRIAGWWLGIPVISTLQNAPQDFNQYRLDRRILAKFTALQLSPYLVAVSQLIRQQFIEKWYIPTEQITSIYNAVDLGPYLGIDVGSPNGSNATNGSQNKSFVITNVARHEMQKAHHILLEAFRLLLIQKPHCQLQLVGNGGRRQELESLAVKLGIQENVHFLGKRRDIPAILKQTDIFVLSSNWEGLPLSAVEAMAAARAVLLTDVGGNSELIESGVNGLLVPPKDPQALCNSLLRLYQMSDDRYRFGKAARQKALQIFDIAKITHQYEALYHKQVRLAQPSLCIAGKTNDQSISI